MTPLPTETTPSNPSLHGSNGHFSFKVIQPNGESVSKHYSCQDSVARLLYETCPDDTEHRPDILVVSVLNSSKMIIDRRWFGASCIFEQVLSCVRESQSALPSSHVILSLHRQQYQIQVFFNSFVRSFLGLPFRSMVFYALNGEEAIVTFVQRVRQQLGLSPEDSRFWLFAKYHSLDKVHLIPEYESVLGVNQDNGAFFQFQFTDEAAGSLMATIKCGYLFVKRKKVFDVIDRKWCILSRDSLTYSHSPGDKTTKQLKGLGNARIYMLDEPKHVEEGLLYGISIVLSSNSKISGKNSKCWLSKVFRRKRPKFSLYSFSRQEIMEWRDALEEAQNPIKQNDLIREVELGTPRTVSPLEASKTVLSLRDEYADVESIYSIFDGELDDVDRELDEIDGGLNKPNGGLNKLNGGLNKLNEELKDRFEKSELQDSTTLLEECFVCEGICVNPIKLEGNYPIHADCFICHKCNELPIDYVIISDDEIRSPRSNGAKIFIACSHCYQRHYSPKCSICMKNITSGSLERKGKLFHATCYFSTSSD